MVKHFLILFLDCLPWHLALALFLIFMPCELWMLMLGLPATTNTACMILYVWLMLRTVVMLMLPTTSTGA